jgi:hypothetical protein
MGLWYAIVLALAGALLLPSLPRLEAEDPAASGHSALPYALEMEAPRLAPKPRALASAKTRLACGRLPFSFEVNRGQAAAEVRYLVRGRRYTAFLPSTGVVLDLRSPRVAPPQPPSLAHATFRISPPLGFIPPNDKADDGGRAVVRMQLVGANPAPAVEGRHKLPGAVNYFIGADPKQWYANIPTYAVVAYQSMYPGVDVVSYGTANELAYDFVLSPGTDPTVVTLALERLGGAAARWPASIAAQGDLVLPIATARLHLRKPLIYQVVEGVKQPIPGWYVRQGQQGAGFYVADYDVGKPLVIHVVMSYASYLGGSGDDAGQAVAVDSAGHVYATGFTASIDFPTIHPAQNVNRGHEDAFVVKIDAKGSTLVYATYLGGDGDDVGHGMAVDLDGNAYVTGSTASADFPTTIQAFQTLPGGAEDAFIVKIAPFSE